jgi:hypothetical protein
VASDEIVTQSAIGRQASPGGREVHQVLRRAEGAAPGPADGGEGPGDDVARFDHARAAVDPVQVGAGQLGQDEVAAPVGVLERVDVDGQAVGMGRPAGLLAGGAADEGGGVVAVPGRVGVQVGGGHRPHLLDREPGPVEPGEHRDDVGGDPPVDDQLAGVGPAVEAAEADRDIAQVPRATGQPGFQVSPIRARIAGLIGTTVERKIPLGGGGSRSTVGSRRSRSGAGVGSTLPNPSGRRGSGFAPTRQIGAGTVVEGRPGGREVGGCGEPPAPVPLLEVASPTGDPRPRVPDEGRPRRR